MAKLITATEIVDIALTNKKNVTGFFNDTLIDIAQENHIKEVLGKDFYDDIVAKNTAATLNADETILLGFIKPALAFYCKLEALADMQMNTTAKGIRVLDDDFSTAATDSQRKDLATKVKQHGDTLASKITEYLEDEDQVGKFTLYEAAKNSQNTVRTRGGIVLTPDDHISDLRRVRINRTSADGDNSILL